MYRNPKSNSFVNIEMMLLNVGLISCNWKFYNGVYAYSLSMARNLDTITGYIVTGTILLFYIDDRFILLLSMI